ncbi:MAG: hypothetical protein ACRDX8_09470 [Acidimicrobiales bacterium]
MTGSLADTPAAVVFEVAAILLTGPKYVLWWIAKFIFKVLIQDFESSLRPGKVVVRFREGKKVVYQEGNVSSVVQRLTEELQTMTVGEFCRNHSLTIPADL